MRYIVRPIDGYLMLIDTEDGPLTYALPDAEFWTWLNSSGTEAELEGGNPERMVRVRKNGVGTLTCNKQQLIDAGFATRAETVSKRPIEEPVLIEASP
jgi:hypothetical protein